MGKNKNDRRVFIRKVLATIPIILGGFLFFKSKKLRANTWQISPNKCVSCGKCETDCVLGQSAVRAFHDYESCGYCDLCFGYFRPNASALNENAENQICPKGAIERKFIEEPYFEYNVIEELCVGCGLCVRGCEAFGNGSLYLQINHKLCLQCNECAIAKVCPSNAISRVSPVSPYIKRYE